MTFARKTSKWPRRWSFPLIGALLATGAPGGLILLRAIRAARLPTLSWAVLQLRSDAATFLYLSVSATAVFVVLGWLVGRAQDRLEVSSITDELTGLMNRRHIEQRLEVERARAARHGTPLALLLLDLDGLKAINDRFGHATGDAVLRAVGHCLKATCRATDLAARFGGDEFLVVAPMTTTADALELAERIRRGVPQVAERAALPATSVSIGVAEVDQADLARVDSFVAAADRALYEAKALGRDRVSSAPPRQPSGDESSPPDPLSIVRERSHAHV